ncbi:condensation domain-containing protein, partial [Actinomadura adrarensis]
MPRLPHGARVPLSPAQARIWFFTQMYPSSTEYNVFDTVLLDAMPSEDQLMAALRTLIERHDGLRLRIFQDGGVPVQEDIGPYEPEVAWHDLSGLPQEEAEAEARDIANAATRELLRPEEPPLVRFIAIRMPSGKGRIVFGFHHLIADYWSWTLLVRELAALL